MEEEWIDTGYLDDRYFDIGHLDTEHFVIGHLDPGCFDIGHLETISISDVNEITSFQSFKTLTSTLNSNWSFLC